MFRRALVLGSVAAFLASAVAAQAQNSIAVLSAVNVRFSNSTATYANPDTFSSAAVGVTCPSSPKVIVSSTSDGTGNVLVDNFMYLSVAQGTSAPSTPANICRGGDVENGNQNDCFTPGYQVPASEGLLTGQDPDGTIAANGGVAPIDISSQLAAGQNTVTLSLIDTGGYLAAASTYLYTNCMSNGAVGGGQISGNPIPSSNPPPSLLTQNFTFSAGTNQLVQGVLDLSVADQQNTLTIQDQTTPIVSDLAFDPTSWPGYVNGTSFATSSCLVHNGEKLTNGNPACKLYTIVCQIGQGGNPTGVQCPTSTERNIVVQDVFDGPNFSLPDIHAGWTTFHQGFGFLEASDGWTGGPCTFEPGSDQTFSCPENLLTLFTGPGVTKGTGTPNGHLNSTFISVGPVPEYLTSVNFNFCAHEKWVNRHNVQATFKTIPPVVPPPNNGFAASPVYSITYGISPQDALPSPEFPVPGDLSLYPEASYPTTGCTISGPAKPFQPAPVTINVAEDGKYFVHYFATDCAGTEELKFYQDNTQSWNTTFFTAELDVDTVKPEIVSGPTLSPAPTMIHGVLGYAKGTRLTASYECTDALSGVEKCGPQIYNNPVADTGTLKSILDTSKPGTFLFNVYVRDAAQNLGTSQSVSYTVVR
jgi:hypothetical protein